MSSQKLVLSGMLATSYKPMGSTFLPWGDKTTNPLTSSMKLIRMMRIIVRFESVEADSPKLSRILALDSRQW